MSSVPQKYLPRLAKRWPAMHSSMTVESSRGRHKLIDDRGVALAWLIDNQIICLPAAYYMDIIERYYHEIFSSKYSPIISFNSYYDANNNVWIKHVYINGIDVGRFKTEEKDNTISWCAKIYEHRKNVLTVITQHLPLPIYEETIDHIL